MSQREQSYHYCEKCGNKSLSNTTAWDIKLPPKGILELWERVEKEWEKIGSEVCQNLIESMPRRVEAVLKAKGGYTKY